MGGKVDGSEDRARISNALRTMSKLRGVLHEANVCDLTVVPSGILIRPMSTGLAVWVWVPWPHGRV